MPRLEDASGSDAPGVPNPDPAILTRWRRLLLAMVGAIMAGGGLDRVAELASAEVHAPVAIVVPQVGEGLCPSHSIGPEDLARLRRYVRARLSGKPGEGREPPEIVAVETPVTTGDEVVGAVLLLALDQRAPAPEAVDVLSVAAIATLSELAVAAVREETEEALRSSFIELIRGNPELSDEDVEQRAYRLGSDLSQGAVALCAELNEDRPRQVIGIVQSEQPQALAEHLDQRIYALVPPLKSEDPVTAALESARRLANSLAPYASVGFSSFCSQPRLFHRAIEEAELMLDVLKHETGGDAADMHSATYRLLIQALASRPDEVTQFYEDTVGPLVHYDERYQTDLVGTIEAYLTHNCNMTATAAGIYAHRHTIAYRLERVRELTGLDPGISEDRERLGLGLKAYRILAPRLRR
jgi:PucR family transcriptional regulator, purine catabolism regulatory protein